MPAKKTTTSSRSSSSMSNSSSSSRSKQSTQSQQSVADRDLMETLLNTTKGACDLYMHGTIESNTSNVHSTMSGVLDETLTMQSEIYNLMSQKGWYPSSKAEQKQITQTKNQYKNG